MRDRTKVHGDTWGQEEGMVYERRKIFKEGHSKTELGEKKTKEKEIGEREREREKEREREQKNSRSQID